LSLKSPGAVTASIARPRHGNVRDGHRLISELPKSTVTRRADLVLAAARLPSRLRPSN
jgi:hypothetical protein